MKLDTTAWHYHLFRLVGPTVLGRTLPSQMNVCYYASVLLGGAVVGLLLAVPAILLVAICAALGFGYPYVRYSAAYGWTWDIREYPVIDAGGRIYRTTYLPLAATLGLFGYLLWPQIERFVPAALQFMLSAPGQAISNIGTVLLILGILMVCGMIVGMIFSFILNSALRLIAFLFRFWLSLAARSSCTRIES